MGKNKEKLTKVFNRFTKQRNIHEAVVLIENTKGDFTYSNTYGAKDVDAPFITASVTKLFTTTCIFKLIEQNKLSLDDKISKYLAMDILQDLHVYKGTDYTDELTVSHLLLQTTGLPDDLEEGVNNTRKKVVQQDEYYSFKDIITLTKRHQPHFAPDQGKRAHYASVNFDILGKIIESITELTLNEAFQQMIYEPLGLKNTYLPCSDADYIPNIYYKDQSLYRPKFIQSCGASGGIISTTRELMIFTKAFINGKLFNKDIFHEQDVNNKLQFAMFPIHYGAGFMRISLNGLMTMFMAKGELIGHSGSTGSFAFYLPEKDLFFVGDLNQMANPAFPVRLAIRLAMAAK